MATKSWAFLLATPAAWWRQLCAVVSSFVNVGSTLRVLGLHSKHYWAVAWGHFSLKVLYDRAVWWSQANLNSPCAEAGLECLILPLGHLGCWECSHSWLFLNYYIILFVKKNLEFDPSFGYIAQDGFKHRISCFCLLSIWITGVHTVTCLMVLMSSHLHKTVT